MKVNIIVDFEIIEIIKTSDEDFDIRSFDGEFLGDGYCVVDNIANVERLAKDSGLYDYIPNIEKAAANLFV